MERCILLICMLVLLGIARLLAPSPAAAWEMRVCAEPENLPYSERSGSGFENKLAAILAEELGASLAWVWVHHPVERAAHMRRGECDLVMGVPDGHRSLLTTIAYYRSTYVFAYRSDSGFEVHSFDDEILRQLKIGVPFNGRGISPPVQALINRGLTGQIEYFPRSRGQSGSSKLTRAAAQGEVDLAIEWGPLAAFSARRLSPDLTIVPVNPQIELPFLPMVFPITMGVRPGDIGLRDRLNVAIADRWDDIQTLLREFDVPLLDLPRPQAIAAGEQ